MGFFSRQPKPDPLSERARTLNDRIAALEAEIRRLSEAPPPAADTTPPRQHPRRDGPHFEPLPASPLDPPAPPKGPVSTAEIGVGRAEPAGWRGWWSRARRHLGGASPSNPQLISYLAAGGIQGLRPLRYERRVARNRLLFLLAVVVLILLLLVMVFVRIR